MKHLRGRYGQCETRQQRRRGHDDVLARRTLRFGPLLSLLSLQALVQDGKSLEFFCFSSSSPSNAKNPTTLQLQLLDRAFELRETVGGHFPSFYDDTSEALSQKLV